MSNAATKAAEQRRLARSMRRATRKRRRRQKIEKLALPRSAQTRRDRLPARQRGVTYFSKDAARLGERQVIAMARDCGLLENLIANTNYRDSEGRPRIQGSWALAYLGYVHSGQPALQRWWRDTYAEMWWEAGFDGRPKYHTVWRRFRELETFAIEEFFHASNELVRDAIQRTQGYVGFDVAVDCTEAETHAKLHHDCGPEDNCSRSKPRRFNRHGRQVYPKHDRAVEHATSFDARKQRREASAKPFNPNAAQETTGDADVRFQQHDDYVRVKVGSCWYRINDPDCGVRAYTRESKTVKFWAGYYNLKATCLYFGAPIFNIVEAADEAEWSMIHEVIERLKATCGEGHVRSIVADRGFAISEVYRRCHEESITLVAPLRQESVNDDGAPMDRVQFDRDGIPRCKHCGGASEYVSYQGGKKPRLWFRCATPVRGLCTTKDDETVAKRQSILCSTDHRYLQPLWRNTNAYQALQHLGLEFERAHHNARQRSATAGNTYDSRIKRTGWAAQQLRANAGVLLDWLKIHDRMGWLDGSICRLDHSDKKLRPYLVDAKAIVKQVRAERRAEGLHRCYGPQAVAKELGPEMPRRRQAVNVDLDEEAQLSVAALKQIQRLEDNFSADLDDEDVQARLNAQIREIVRADAAEQGYRLADDPDPPPDSAHDPPGWGQVTEDEPF